MMMISSSVGQLTMPQVESFKVDKNDPNVFFYRILDPSNPFELECKIKGQGLFKVKWFKDDQQIQDDQIEGIQVNDRKLNVFAPDIENHRGFYHCEASNDKGTAKSEVIRFR